MDVKKWKWIVRFFLIVPLLSSIYCLFTIYGSSQSKFCKVSLSIWFIFAALLSETCFELPQFLLVMESREDRRTKGRRFGPGLSLPLQLCHVLGILLVHGYHGLVYAICLNYSPTYFGHLPGIFIAITVIANLKNYSVRHVFNRTSQLFTGSIMIYICILVGNWFGALGSVFNLFGFWVSKKPTGKLQLDEVYLFFVGIYFSIIMHSLAIVQMIESPIIVTDFFLGLTS